MKTVEKYLNEGAPIKGKINALKTVMKNIFDELSKDVKYEEGAKLVKKASKLAEIEELQNQYIKAILNFLK